MNQAQAVVVQRLLKATPERVFTALTDAEIMSQWFFARPGWSATVENSFEVGGAYSINLIGPEGHAFAHTGEYREIVPNQKIVFTWNSLTVRDTLVTIELKPVAEQTELTLTHELITDPVQREQHDQGWNFVLQNLENIL